MQNHRDFWRITSLTIHDHLSGLGENHPFLKTIAAEVHEFLAKEDASHRMKFEVIQGGADDETRG